MPEARLLRVLSKEPEGVLVADLLRRAKATRGPLHSLERRLRVELLHCRGGAAGEILELELGHETSHVCLVSELADPAPHSQRAYGG